MSRLQLDRLQRTRARPAFGMVAAFTLASTGCVDALGIGSLPRGHVDAGVAGAGGGAGGSADGGAGTGACVVARLPFDAGARHAAALLDSGELKVWGDNEFGQAAQPTNTAIITTPVTVPLPFEPVAIALGPSVTCAWNDGGPSVCWGRNHDAQLGLGFAGDPVAQPSEVITTNSSRVFMGVTHGCSLEDSGAVRCWGRNDEGQLGVGSFSGVEAMPLGAAILPLAADALTVGTRGACAHLSDDSVWCWGDRALVNLGGVDSATPVDSGLRGVVHVEAGDAHVCAALDSGTVFCWGNNDGRQINTDEGIHQFVPTAIPGIDNAVEVCSGWRHSCARLADGGVKCWGLNAMGGQLGAGGDLPVKVFPPVDVIGLEQPVLELACIWGGGCVRLGGGELRCWGRNTQAEVGDGTTTHRNQPTPVAW